MFNRQKDIEVPASILIFNAFMTFLSNFKDTWEELQFEHFIISF